MINADGAAAVAESWAIAETWGSVQYQYQPLAIPESCAACTNGKWLSCPVIISTNVLATAQFGSA
jgi:hypothetical protein